MRKSVMVAALAFVVVTSGCGPASKAGTDQERTPQVLDVAQKIDPSQATTLEFGDTLEVVSDLPSSFGGDSVRFQGFAEDGVLVGTARAKPDEADTVDGPPPIGRSRPVMYDLDTEKFTVLDARDRPELAQIDNVSGNEHTVVWAEVVGTQIDHSEFTIYAYDRQTEEVTTIGEFNDADGQIVFGHDLAIAGDTAYFSTPAYPKKRGEEAVYAVPVDGSNPPRVIAPGGEEVRISGDTLTYRVRNPDEEAAYPKYFMYDIPTEETTPVPVSAHVDEPGFCGAEFTDEWETWCVGRAYDDQNSRPALLTIKETSGRTTEFAPFPIDPHNVPAPSDIISLGRWTVITVSTEDGQDRAFLADLDTKGIKAFPDNTSFGSLSPDRSQVLVSSYASKGPGPGPQRIVKIPTA
jgi:hypothetical protein